MKKTNNLSLFANCVLVNWPLNFMFLQIWGAPEEEAKSDRSLATSVNNEGMPDSDRATAKSPT